MDSSLLPASKRPKFAQGMETLMPKSESFKFLCFCLKCPTETALTRYRLMAVPISELFRTEQHEADDLLDEVQLWEDDYYTGMGLLPTKDHGLYVVSHGRGRPPYDFFVVPPDMQINMLKYSMMVSEENLLHVIEDKPTSSMPSRCRHMDPIVVEIDGSIYVLSTIDFELTDSDDDEESTTVLRAYDSVLRAYDSTAVFQVYDPACDTWEPLPPPPFMCHGSTSLKHVVVRNKLCITTDFLSCEFNTKSKLWEPCKLFGEGGVTFYGENYGPPFKFDSEGLVIDNKFLVCIILSSGVVVYKINDDGKVDLDFELLYPGCDKEWLCGGKFADMGNGCFCVLSMLPFEIFRPKPQIKFVKFKVSVAENGSRLICDEKYISTVSFKKGPSWEQVTSFFAC